MAGNKPRKTDIRAQRQVAAAQKKSAKKTKSTIPSPAAKAQERILGKGNVRGFTPSGRTRMMRRDGSLGKEAVTWQVPDLGDEPPLNNRFGPAFDPIIGEQLMPGQTTPPPARRGTFEQAHAIAREIGIKDATTNQLSWMMQTRDGVTRSSKRPRGSKVKLIDMARTSPEEQKKPARGIDEIPEVYPDPRNKRNNERPLGPNERWRP